MRSVGSHSTSEREKEGIKERTGGLPYSLGKPQKTSARRPSDGGAVRTYVGYESDY